MKLIAPFFLMIVFTLYILPAEDKSFDKLRDSIIKEDIELLESEIKAGLDLETYNEDSKESIFSIALNAEKEKVIELFLKHGKNPNITDSNNFETPLFIATKLENEKMINLLLKYKADPLFHVLLDKIDERIYQVNQEKEPVFITGNSDIEQMDEYREIARDISLFISAIEQENNRFIELCINNHLDLNKIYRDYGVDPLNKAISCGNQYAMELMLDHGIDITIIDLENQFRTPLSLAIDRFGENTVFVQLLKRKNAYNLRYPFRTAYQASVTVDRLRIRKSPNLKGDIIGFLMTGNIVDMIEVTPTASDIDFMQYPWIKIRFENKEGWVFGGYLDAHLGSRGY